MSKAAMEQVERELNEMATAYAAKVEDLASDPYFRDAVLKVAVSSLLWKLFWAYQQDTRSLEVLRDELKQQTWMIEKNVNRVIGQDAPDQ